MDECSISSSLHHQCVEREQGTGGGTSDHSHSTTVLSAIVSLLLHVRLSQHRKQLDSISAAVLLLDVIRSSIAEFLVVHQSIDVLLE